MTFEPFQKFFSIAANRYGVSKELQAAKICHEFRAIIPGFFKGIESVETHISPAYFKKNILVINVENPGWAQEIIIRKPKIIEEMNKKAGKEVIKNLQTQIASIEK